MIGPFKRRDDRDYHNQACINALPLALILIPYALLRSGVDHLRGRR